MKTVPSNIKFVSGRFFLDIATGGCGSGCVYCYIPDANKLQVLIDRALLEVSLDFVMHHPEFIKGVQGSIISLCPSTEPFKSEESARLIELIMMKFLPLGNPIQISTKELIPLTIIELAQQHSIGERQVYFNISTSCISRASIIEPKATPIEIRLSNFEILKAYNKLTSCLYIKPFIIETLNDTDKFVELINQYKPDVCCVGVKFKKNTLLGTPCDLLYHCKDVVEKEADLDAVSKIVYFRNQIEIRTTIPVFHSSTCIIGNYLKYRTNRNIVKVVPTLCRKCNGCISIQEELYVQSN